jgi:hypothetical protein
MLYTRLRVPHCGVRTTVADAARLGAVFFPVRTAYSGAVRLRRALRTSASEPTSA